MEETAGEGGAVSNACLVGGSTLIAWAMTEGAW